MILRRVTRLPKSLRTTTRIFSSNPVQDQLEERAKALRQSEPEMERLFVFNADRLSELPEFLSWFEPFVEAGKDTLVATYDFTGLPFWAILATTCIAARAAISPLILVQIKKFTDFSSAMPVISALNMIRKRGKGNSGVKTYNFYRSVFKLMKKQGVHPSSLVAYNLVHIPFLISVVWTIRRALSLERIHSESFLWIENYLEPDPYFIIPGLACGLFYYNFGKGLTKETRQTTIGKIKETAQLLTIPWFFILTNWPSGISFYICCNAMISVAQSTAMGSFWFFTKINPKMLLGQILIAGKEYEVKESENLYQAIRQGEESWLHQELSEEDLFRSSKDTFSKMSKIQSKDELRSKFGSKFGLQN